MRLNLGCGSRKLEGFVNVDKYPGCEPDLVHDLEILPWPFPDDGAEAVVLRHVLEHLGREPALFLDLMRELYRVCAPGASVTITVPHPRHDDFLSDPTHVRPITPQGMELFSQAKNQEWDEAGRANTPLGRQLAIDFATVSVTMMPDPPWRRRLDSGELKPRDLAQAARQFNNVIKEVEIVLRAVKPAGA